MCCMPGWLYLHFSSLAYGFFVANDPLLDAFNDFILMIHLGMGLAFFIYVWANFWEPLAAGAAISRILYQPRRVILPVAAGLGLMVTLLLVLRADITIAKQFLAGQYNAIADGHSMQDDGRLAERFYRESLDAYDTQHRANYSLATLAIVQDQTQYAIEYLEQARYKDVRPQTYALLASLYRDKYEYLNAYFTLRGGVKKFPKSGRLANDLGLIYYKLNSIDSSFYYLRKAQQLLGKQAYVATGNILALAAKKDLYENMQEADFDKEVTNDLAYATNQMALLNLKGLAGPQEVSPALLADTVLGMKEYAYLYNYAINKIKQPGTLHDTTALALIKQFRQNPANAMLSNDLNFLQAIINYQHGNRREAVRRLKDIYNHTENLKGYYGQRLGVWALANEAPKEAVNYFSAALQRGDPQARIVLLAGFGSYPPGYGSG